MIRVAGLEKDKEIRKRLWYHIKKMELPVDPEDLRITRHGGTMKISLRYKEVFYVKYKALLL